MAKKTTRSKQRQSRETLDERAARAERQMLERSVRQQKKIRALSRQLVREISSASGSLRELGRVILDRETPVERSTEEPAPVE